ncbi:hypothetical protein VTK26DRAFT_1949 [Humicola hyalothermophila]
MFKFKRTVTGRHAHIERLPPAKLISTDKISLARAYDDFAELLSTPTWNWVAVLIERGKTGEAKAAVTKAQKEALDVLGWCKRRIMEQLEV